MTQLTPPPSPSNAPQPSRDVQPTADSSLPARAGAQNRPAVARASIRARVVIGVAIVAAVVLTIFCAQNTGAVGVKFLVWGWPGAPLFVVVLASVGLGIVIGAIFVWLRLIRYSAERRLLGRGRSAPTPGTAG